MVERCGIRCCYHGWLYDVDGRVLETPGEPPDSTFKDRFFHGAYPTLEYKGLIFAYLGLRSTVPSFRSTIRSNCPATGWCPAEKPNRNTSMTATGCSWRRITRTRCISYFSHDPEEARAKWIVTVRA